MKRNEPTDIDPDRRGAAMILAAVVLSRSSRPRPRRRGVPVRGPRGRRPSPTSA